MGAKDNFAQAMKELLNGGENKPVEANEDKKVSSTSFSSFSQPESRPPKTPAPEPREESRSKMSFGMTGSTTGTAAPSQPSKEEKQTVLNQPVETQPIKQEQTAQDQPAEPKPQPASEQPKAAFVPPVRQESTGSLFNSSISSIRSASEPAPAPQEKPAAPTFSDVQYTKNGGTQEMTVIGEGTTIVGDITTQGQIKIGGSVKGNIRAQGAVELNGKIIGDIEGADVTINSSQVRGNITAYNMLSIDSASVVVGDVSAKNAESGGKVKGNFTAEDKSYLQSSAVLVGNLVSGKVTIEEGATLKGDISITNSNDENIVMDDLDFDIQI